MRGIRMIAAVMIAVPGIALAQVGPNPAASGGSLDPTVGPMSDHVTAPDDTPVGTNASGTASDSAIVKAPVGTRDADTTTTRIDEAGVTPAKPATEARRATKAARGR